jgi:hypothetical protein
MPAIYGHDERRHIGFSVRLGAGAGYGWAKRKLPQGSTRVHGLDGMLTLDVGAAAIENLIVYGRVAGLGWNQLGAGGSSNAGSAYAGLLGAGARYYLMPWNVYGSATAALAVLKITNDLGKAQNAHPGLGLDLEIGQDFWAGTPLDRRAIGLALRFNWVHCGAAGTGLSDPKPWNAFTLSFVFSVGYN